MDKHRIVGCQSVPLMLATIATSIVLGATPTLAETYEYDDVGRLTEVVYDDGTQVNYTYDDAGNILSNQTLAPDIAAPTTTADPAGGTFSSEQMIVLSCDDDAGSGCDETYFTTNGIDPTTSSATYSSPIAIAATTTLKFFSADNEDNRESIQTESYVIEIPNNPPSAFTLVSPGANALGLETTVTFVWTEASDPDGDDLSYQFFICEVPNFAGCESVLVAKTETLIRYAGAESMLGGLLLFGVFLATGLRSNGTAKRTKRLGTTIALGALIVGLISSCGGGSGKDDEKDKRPAGPNEISHTEMGLSPATKYYWKVRADDGTDTTESETREFDTE